MWNNFVSYFINRKSSYLRLRTKTLKRSAIVRLGTIVRFAPLAYGAVLLAAACVSHFAILINDAFPLRWQADHLSLSHPESFYNGFFPIVYPLLLRLATEVTGNPLHTLILLQIALSPLYALLAYRLLREFVSERATILALPFVLFSPDVVRAILNPTPEFLASLAVLAGLAWFAQAKGMKSVVLAGVGVGIGCLFRSHVIVLAAGFAIAMLLIEMRNIKMLAYFLAGVLPFVILQGLLQVWSRHGFFENLQVFNVWKTMYGMDWNNPPFIGNSSAFQVVMQNPFLFLKWYSVRLLNSSPYIVTLIALLIVATMTFRVKHGLVMLSLATLFYIVVTTAGSSSQNLTLAIPVVAVTAIFLVEMVAAPLIQRRMVVPVLAGTTIAIALTGLFYYFSLTAKRVEDYAEVERLIPITSTADAAIVYADDFDLYFPNIDYATPRTSGGWPGIGIPNYADEYPQIRDTSATVEHDDLARIGIRWAVFRIPPYDGRGYESIRSDSSLFRLTYRTRLHEIYRVQ
jgi:hypothetical protein